MPDFAERCFLVSIHDVSPVHAARLTAVRALLHRHGIRGPALFLVPNWHGDWLLDRHPEFVADLRGQVGEGAEVFLHGFRHDEVGLRRSLPQRLRALGRTAGEAEFLSLDPDAAARRITDGIEVLHRHGLAPVGFVPPAWLHGRGLSAVLAARGLDLTEDAWAVWSVTKRIRVRAPAVRWSTRAAHRAVAGIAIARLRRPVDRMYRVVRLAIHPPDIEHPLVAQSLERTLTVLAAERRPMSYRELLHGA